MHIVVEYRRASLEGFGTCFDSAIAACAVATKSVFLEKEFLMFKPAILLLIPLVLCSCSPEQATVATKSDDKPENTLFPVKVDDKYGYMDRNGKLVVDPQYAGASRFSEGLAAVQLKKAEKVGYIDVSGKLVIPLEFDLADPFSEGFAAVMQNRKWGYIDKTGQVVIPATFGSAQPFVGGKAGVAVLGSISAVYGYINRKGEFQTDKRYEMAMPFREGLAAVRSFGENFKFIDPSGKAVIPPQFLSAGEFGDGLAPVQTQTPEGVRWGYINKEGKLVIPARFTNALLFSEGLGPVQMLDGKWGFLDAKNNMVIAPQWEQAASFSYGLSQVWTGGKFGYIGKDGKYVWEPK
jgi:hypothetical protein